VIDNVVGKVGSGLFLCLIIYLYVTTFYIIDADVLVIKISFIPLTIKIKDIKSIEPTISFTSAPAFSIFHRIRIIYSKGSVTISPWKVREFCRELKRINPAIQTWLD
jgi:hypothetical protein